MPEHDRTLIEERKLRIRILDDRGGEWARSLHLENVFPDDLKAVYQGFGVDLSQHNGDGAWELPLPARFVLDSDGIVRFADVRADYTTRPEVDETLDQLDQLTQTT